MLKYTIVLTKEPDGRFSVTVPALPGCFTWGSTREETIENAREAIQAYLESCVLAGEPLPREDVAPSVVVEVPEPSMNR